MLKEDKQEKKLTPEETLGDKVDKIFSSITGIGKKISAAIEEEAANELVLVSVKNMVLDFNLVEEDVKQIHKRLERDGSRVLGSYLILNDKQDTMEIQSYKQSGDKTFITSTKTKVSRANNLPPDVHTELQEKGSVKLFLKFE